MVQVSGDTPSFNANSTAADYVLWARGKGVNVALQPNAPLSRALLSQALVQLLQINPNKLGGDPTRILAREGITIDGTSTDPVTLPDVLSLLGGLQGRILLNPSPHANGNGFGFGLGNNPNHNPPTPPPGNPPPNSGNPHRTHNPHIP